MKLSQIVDMIAILESLESSPSDANNFKRIPLAILASESKININSGIACITPGGRAFLKDIRGAAEARVA